MTTAPVRVVFESFGVTAEVVVSETSLLSAVHAILPPGWQPGARERIMARFALTSDGRLIEDGETVPLPPGDSIVVGALDSAIRALVSFEARANTFVHAGVVAREGWALVIPGASFSGKTTLVAALVAAGLEYFSDEFAVLDSDGLVHPYPKPLSMREPGQFRQIDRDIGDLGGVRGSRPARVAVIARAPFVSGGTWRPQRASASEGALALLAHTIPARERPAQTLGAVRRAVEHAVFVEGERGGAESAARTLAALLEERVAAAPGSTRDEAPIASDVHVSEAPEPRATSASARVAASRASASAPRPPSP